MSDPSKFDLSDSPHPTTNEEWLFLENNYLRAHLQRITKESSQNEAKYHKLAAELDALRLILDARENPDQGVQKVMRSGAFYLTDRYEKEAIRKQAE